MAKILVVSRWSAQIIHCDAVPSVGDTIGCFDMTPLPVVNKVVWWPSKELLCSAGL